MDVLYNTTGNRFLVCVHRWPWPSDHELFCVRFSLVFYASVQKKVNILPLNKLWPAAQMTKTHLHGCVWAPCTESDPSPFTFVLLQVQAHIIRLAITVMFSSWIYGTSGLMSVRTEIERSSQHHWLVNELIASDDNFSYVYFIYLFFNKSNLCW